MVEDKELIRQYASSRSEAAFAELVSRHLKMVYAAALRQVNGDFHLAEDVAQSVFTDLARKAGRLQCSGSVAGWLYASTRFAAANAVRSEARRRVREQTVAVMNEIHSNNDTGWDELKPIIDEALAKLGDADREAIVLRYFESFEYALVGTALGVSESGARKRVERALEKLRGVLQRRGLTATGAVLAGVLTESSATAVPVNLAAGITHAALTQAATTAAGSATSTILKLFAMKKFALLTIGVLAVSLATVVVVKTAPKPTPGVKVVQASVRITLASGETLVTGGWPMEAGKRVFVFVTPVWMDSAGAKIQAPQGAKPQVVITGQFVEGSEQDFVKLGLKPFFVTENDSKVAVKYSSAQLQSVMDAIKTNPGADILSAPRVITLAGLRAAVSATEVQTIAGKEETLGPSIDLLPSISADGVSVDLAATVRLATASTQ